MDSGRRLRIIGTAAAIGFGISPAVGASCTEKLLTVNAEALVAAMEARSPESVLWHGSGCYSEDAEAPDRCDWKTEIKADKPLGEERRLVVLSSSHNTGSGARDFVRIYGCSGGQLKVLFEGQFLYGVSVEESTPSRLVLISGRWAADDAQCCPSARVRQTFIWDSQQGRYVKARTDVLPLVAGNASCKPRFLSVRKNGPDAACRKSA